MAKKKIHIDELFRRELGDMKMPVDNNDWAAMQAQISAGQDKRKRRALWWWLMGIVLLLSGSATTYYFLNSENPQSKNVIVENSASTPSIETPEENNPSSSNKTETEIGNSTLNQPANNEPSSPESTEAKTNDSPSSTSKPSSAKEETEEPKDKVDGVWRRKLESFRNRGNRNNNGKEDSGENTGTKGTDTPYPKKEQQTFPKTTPKPTITENNDSNTTEESIVTKVVLPDSAKTAGDSLKQAKKVEPTKKGKDGSLPKLSPLSLGFSLGTTSNSFTADENSDFGRILNNGNQPAFGFNALFSANYAFNNFEINSGLGINNITNSGSYNYTHQTFDSLPVFGPGGDILGYFFVNFRDTSHNFNLTSSLASVTLPLGVNYKIPLSTNMGLRVGANTSINYLVSASGEYINPFNLFKLDVDNNQDLFRKWNVGVGASVGYYYTFKPQWSLETSVNYNTFVNGIFDDRIGTAIRPSSIGVNVGIRYNFKLRK